MNPDSIITERLELRPMKVEFLEAVHDGRYEDAEQLEGVRLYKDVGEPGQQFLQWRITAMKAVPELGPWIGRYFVRKADNQLAGDCALCVQSP